jgi:hypothetical protein
LMFAQPAAVQSITMNAAARAVPLPVMDFTLARFPAHSGNEPGKSHQCPHGVSRRNLPVAAFAQGERPSNGCNLAAHGG